MPEIASIGSIRITMHHDELMIDWDLARQSLPLKTISTSI